VPWNFYICVLKGRGKGQRARKFLGENAMFLKKKGEGGKTGNIIREVVRREEWDYPL